MAIIGGGFSGAAAAIHLSRRSLEPLELLVIEPRASLGAGVAHSTQESDHRLNGPAGIHSLYPEVPGHFADWLRDSGHLAGDPQAVAANGLVFARRRDFGRYVAEETARHSRSNPSDSRIRHVRGSALRIRPGRKSVTVEMVPGEAIPVERCILAVGWNASGVPREFSEVAARPEWFGDPWQTGRLDAIARDESVVLVGAGLTASDTLAALVARGHRGPIYAISRRGLRPGRQNPHRSTRPVWDRVVDPDPDILRRLGYPKTVREAVRLLRREIAGVEEETSSWHTPFDELRDACWLFWGKWPETEQRRFVRHLKHWYDAYRYRNPPQVERIVDESVRSGQLSFRAGRIQSARAVGTTLEIEYIVKASGTKQSIRAGAVINCTGPQLRPSTSGNPFWNALIADDVARDAPCGLGIDVTSDGRVIDGKGRPNDRLFAVGPPTMGQFGESVAVPYIMRGLLDIVARIGSLPG